MSDWEIVGKPNYNNKDQFEVVNNNKEKDSTFSRVIKSLMDIPGQVKEAGKHPLDTAQDLGAGFVGSLQRSLVSMGELGQKIGESPTINPLLALGIHAPESLRIKSPNIRELSGLGKDNRMDLREVLSSGNQNPLPGNIGQYLIGGAAGGSSLLGQFISNSLWSAAQAEPGNRLEEGVLGGALSMIPTALVKGGAKAAPYFNPRNYGKVKLNHLENEMNSAQIANENQQNTISSLKENLNETGSSSTGTLSKQVLSKQKEIDSLKPLAQTPYEETKNLLNWPENRDILTDALSRKENLVSELGQYLGKGEKLDVDVARKINESVKQTKKEIQSNYYDPVEKFAKESFIAIPRSELKQVDSTVKQLLSDKTFIESPDFNEFKAIIKKHTSNDIIPSKDFLQQWKETKQAAQIASRKAYKEGGENQAYWKNQSDKLKGLADSQLAVLERSFPERIFSKLTDADRLWKEKVIPFYGNKIYEQSKKLGRIDSSNILEELRGSGMGQEQVKNLILSDPELLKKSIGMVFSEKPNNLLNASPYENEFISKLPNLNQMIDDLRSSNNSVSSAKNTVSESESRRKLADELHSGIVSSQQQRINSIHKIEKIGKEIEDLTNKKNLLKTELNKGKVTKERFDRLTKEYNEKIEKHKSFVNNAKKMGYGAGAALGFRQVYDYFSENNK